MFTNGDGNHHCRLKASAELTAGPYTVCLKSSQVLEHMSPDCRRPYFWTSAGVANVQGQGIYEKLGKPRPGDRSTIQQEQSITNPQLAVGIARGYLTCAKSCDGFDCPHPLRLRNKSSSRFCAQATCSGDDTKTCCEKVLCPIHSSRVSARSGCACDPGFDGKDSIWNSTTPWEVQQCTPVPCPDGSTGKYVHEGCSCHKGVGHIVPTAKPPYYTATCTETRCPQRSSGISVGKGCHCNPGFNGTISLSHVSPFYTGKCDAGFPFVVKDDELPHCLSAKAYSSQYNIEFADCDYSEDQQWYFDDESRMRWSTTGKCLVNVGGYSVTLSDCNHGANWQWNFSKETQQLSQKSSGLCLGYTSKTGRWSTAVFLGNCTLALRPWALHMVAGKTRQM